MLNIVRPYWPTCLDKLMQWHHKKLFWSRKILTKSIWTIVYQWITLNFSPWPFISRPIIHRTNVTTETLLHHPVPIALCQPEWAYPFPEAETISDLKTGNQQQQQPPNTKQAYSQQLCYPFFQALIQVMDETKATHKACLAPHISHCQSRKVYQFCCLVSWVLVLGDKNFQYTQKFPWLGNNL